MTNKQANTIMDLICKTICNNIGNASQFDIKSALEKKGLLPDKLNESIFNSTRNCFIEICNILNITEVEFTEVEINE